MIKGKLSGLIEYQRASVVSKEIVKGVNGSVTLFAFDHGQGLSEHIAPFDAFVYVFDGEVEILISGKPHHLKEGETTVMPANKPHSLKAATPFKMLLVLIKK
ncbi:MAG: cupin domain-containing protein [Candidatus Omnitrophota bacterium]